MRALRARSSDINQILDLILLRRFGKKHNRHQPTTENRFTPAMRTRASLPAIREHVAESAARSHCPALSHCPARPTVSDRPTGPHCPAAKTHSHARTRFARQQTTHSDETNSQCVKNRSKIDAKMAHFPHTPTKTYDYRRTDANQRANKPARKQTTRTFTNHRYCQTRLVLRQPRVPTCRRATPSPVKHFGSVHCCILRLKLIEPSTKIC